MVMMRRKMEIMVMMMIEDELEIQELLPSSNFTAIYISGKAKPGRAALNCTSLQATASDSG